MTANDFTRWPDELPQLEELIEAKLSLTIGGKARAATSSSSSLSLRPTACPGG